jgi:SAM-dependent methyltransferase
VRLNDPAVVAAEYASEDGFEGRRAAYRYGIGSGPREVARVLRPGGRLVAVTNGADHWQGLTELVGFGGELRVRRSPCVFVADK